MHVFVMYKSEFILVKLFYKVHLIENKHTPFILCITVYIILIYDTFNLILSLKKASHGLV